MICGKKNQQINISLIRRLETGVHGRNKGRKEKKEEGDNDDDKKAREEGRSKSKMTKR